MSDLRATPYHVAILVVFNGKTLLYNITSLFTAVAADTDCTNVYNLPGDEYYEDMAEENAEYISASGVYFLPNSHGRSNDPISVNNAACCTEVYVNENNMLGEQADPGQFGSYVLDAKIASDDE